MLTIACLLLLGQAVKSLAQPCEAGCESPGQRLRPRKTALKLTPTSSRQRQLSRTPTSSGSLKSDQWGPEPNLLKPALPLFECLQRVILQGVVLQHGPDVLHLVQRDGCRHNRKRCWLVRPRHDPE